MNKLWSRATSLARKAAAVTFSFAVLLVSLEIGLSLVFWIKDSRSAVIKVPAVDKPYTYFTFSPDPVLLTNEDGLYTKAARAKASGKFRIILVGGSVARSSQGRIPYEQTIAAELERALNSRLKTNSIEVINAGVAAYVAEQEFILIQLVLQQYQPDMIVTLDGYNDVLSFDANRPDDAAYAPIDYRRMKVIEQGKEQESAFYRLRVCFKNVLRAKRYFMAALSRDERRDYSSISDAQIERAAAGYLGILRDMKDFASAKQIALYSFLQPVRWYAPESPQHARLAGVPQLAKLYSRYEEGIRQYPWARSLTDVFEKNLDLYNDDCHVKARGNEIFAAAMADFLEPKLGVQSETGRVIIAAP